MSKLGSLRFMLAGLFCLVFGIIGLIDGLNNGFMERTIGGLLWKGPLLALAGLGALVMGYRMFRQKVSPNDLNGGVDHPGQTRSTDH